VSGYPEIAARFARDTDGHELRILRDDSLYRHLMFFNSNYGDLYRFDLVTWSNHLVIRGDGPTFVFSLYPLADLLDMFRKTARVGEINADYWQEKALAGKVQDWSEEKFRTWLIQEAARDEARCPGLVQAVDRQILNSDEHSLEYRGTAEYALASFTHRDYRLRFPDRWEEPFEDYSWEFLWACHAIRWGIAQYDAVKAAPKVVAS
jgi:hypothetical protein